MPTWSGSGDTVLARFQRLTAREIRLLVLSVDHGHSYNELASALGVSHAHVTNTLSRIRRKLGVPRGQQLMEFVGNAPELANALLPFRSADVHMEPAVTHRRKDVLRVTIAELQRLASVARRRAAALESLVGGDDLVQRGEEAAMVDRIADLIDQAVAQTLLEARQDIVGARPAPANIAP